MEAKIISLRLVTFSRKDTINSLGTNLKKEKLIVKLNLSPEYSLKSVQEIRNS